MIVAAVWVAFEAVVVVGTVAVFVMRTTVGEVLDSVVETLVVLDKSVVIAVVLEGSTVLVVDSSKKMVVAGESVIFDATGEMKVVAAAFVIGLAVAEEATFELVVWATVVVSKAAVIVLRPAVDVVSTFVAVSGATAVVAPVAEAVVWPATVVNVASLV